MLGVEGSQLGVGRGGGRTVGMGRTRGRTGKVHTSRLLRARCLQGSVEDTKQPHHRITAVTVTAAVVCGVSSVR